ncbi:MAG: phosphoribosyltransferase [Bacteroidia bacterium]|nr:phosphoribosyltransferase [Bacteroidia bacterium]
MEKTIILNDDDIRMKTERLAFEIMEENYEEKQLFLVGILPNGKALAEQIIQHIRQNLPGVDCRLITAAPDNKNTPNAAVHFEGGIEDSGARTVILIDDVLNSGKTMAAVLREILQHGPARVKTAVMVERAYKDFPITADYKGISVSTNIQDHIEVDLGSPAAAWLM